MSFSSSGNTNDNPIRSKYSQEQSLLKVRELLEEWFFDTRFVAVGKIDNQPSLSLSFKSGMRIEMWVGLNWQLRISKINKNGSVSKRFAPLYKIVSFPQHSTFATIPGYVVSEFAQLYLDALDHEQLTTGMSEGFLSAQRETIKTYQLHWTTKYQSLRKYELEKSKARQREAMASEGFGWLMIFGVAIVVLTVAGALFS